MSNDTPPSTGWATDPGDLLRVGPDFDLATFDRAATPGWEFDDDAADAFRQARGELLAEMQERLFAHARAGGRESVLLVVQGLDTAGKGGIIRHVAGMMDPQGLAIRSFGVPTAEERKHHYLWRIRRALPEPGKIGIFDRSHYEDVLVVRVEKLADVDWEKRFAEINRFEQQVLDRGTTIVKVALMVSRDEQGLRLMERLDRPDKNWKFNPNDVDTRARWDDYQAAYADMLARTSTPRAPWYVIPADRKWYARLAVTELLAQALAALQLEWPTPQWDVEVQRQRLATTMTPEALAAAKRNARKEVREAHEEIAEHAAAVAAVNALAAEDALAARDAVTTQNAVATRDAVSTQDTVAPPDAVTTDTAVATQDTPPPPDAVTTDTAVTAQDTPPPPDAVATPDAAVAGSGESPAPAPDEPSSGAKKARKKWLPRLAPGDKPRR